MPSTRVRIPSKCREWERERRNRFNDAISKLGEVLKEKMSQTIDSTKEEQVPVVKVEILIKAVDFIKKICDEKAQSDAVILSLRVKIEELETKKRSNIKDTATQTSKRPPNSKKVYLGRFKCAKKNRLPAAIRNNDSTMKAASLPFTLPKLPALLPKSKQVDKRQDKTIIVMPAPSYFMPNRPLMVPQPAPPTLFLVDSSFQMPNRIPIIARTSHDVTKTTMVNNLPITAYSQPLSLSKKRVSKNKGRKPVSKNTSDKEKTNIVKRNDSNVHKNVPKTSNTNVSESNNKNLSTSEAVTTIAQVVFNKIVDTQNTIRNTSNDLNAVVQKQDKEAIALDSSKIELLSTTSQSKLFSSTTFNKADSIPPSITNSATDIKLDKKNEISKETDCVVSNFTISQNAQSNNHPVVSQDVSNINNNLVFLNTDDKAVKICVPQINKSSSQYLNNENENDSNKGKDTAKNQVPSSSNIFKADQPKNCDKIVSNPTSKCLSDVAKRKDEKITSIIDTSLCENTVDAGNARLELAEELLASSPTAAFLMSFPLVSGNRADSPAYDPKSSILPTQGQINYQVNNFSDNFLQKSSNLDYKSGKETKSLSLFDFQQTGFQEKNNISVNNFKSKGQSLAYCVSNENPFLHLPTISTVPITSISEGVFQTDLDCNIPKTSTFGQPASINSNFMLKSDGVNTNRCTIYSNNSLPTGPDYSTLSLYPCAMEKYSSKLNKSDYLGTDENISKYSGSRLTYDVDLGLPHKSFEFATPTIATNLNPKENILTTSASTLNSYNPFNTDFHVSLSNSTSSKRITTKSTPFYTDSITNLYSQPATLWHEDLPFYGNNNIHMQKTVKKNQNTLVNDSQHGIPVKSNDNISGNKYGIGQLISEKKKPNKMHINWMTSEPQVPNNQYDVSIHLPSEQQDSSKTHAISQQIFKKSDYVEPNYFPISVPNFTSHIQQDDFQVWPVPRPLGTAEISIEPPPINLPTLVGDLALGPHDRKRANERNNRSYQVQNDVNSCNNFLSVSQLMDRSTDNTNSNRFNINSQELQKTIWKKDYTAHSEQQKLPTAYNEYNPVQPYYYNDPKMVYSLGDAKAVQSKTKIPKTIDKNPKPQKNNYSAEALLRGGNTSQRITDNNIKYNASQDMSMAQISHFPTLIQDFSETTYSSQAHSGPALYNSTTNTMTTSLYSNFIPASSSIMPTTYSHSNYTPEVVDFNANPDYNFTKTDSYKHPRNTIQMVNQDKQVPLLRNSRKDSSKHKLDCSKKESSKKNQIKKAKIGHGMDEWHEQNEYWLGRQRKNTNFVYEEMNTPHYIGGQVVNHPVDTFNAAVCSAAVAGLTNSASRSMGSYPMGSRTNFNLSTIFPEITKQKVQ